jgi:hypothetical protein
MDTPVATRPLEAMIFHQVVARTDAKKQDPCSAPVLIGFVNKAPRLRDRVLRTYCTTNYILPKYGRFTRLRMAKASNKSSGAVS